jgi:hypothetical protein
MTYHFGSLFHASPHGSRAEIGASARRRPADFLFYAFLNINIDRDASLRATVRIATTVINPPTTTTPASAIAINGHERAGRCLVTLFVRLAISCMEALAADVPACHTPLRLTLEVMP